MSEFQFNTIDEILEDLRDGKIVVMIDDEDRENEGDVVCSRACHLRKCEFYGKLC